MAHKYPRWVFNDLAFAIVTDMSDDPVVTIVVTTPSGVLSFMAEPESQGRTMILHATHVQGAEANEVGIRNLMVLAQAAMQRMDLDEIIVKGAIRTTGANPGNHPWHTRFARRDRPPTAP